jgi:hypothetical protein
VERSCFVLKNSTFTQSVKAANCILQQTIALAMIRAEADAVHRTGYGSSVFTDLDLYWSRPPALARYGAIDRSVVFGSRACGVMRQASRRLERLFPHETDACVALLVNYRISHGTVLVGLSVSQENGGVALQKNFKDGELRYVCNIAGDLR